MVDDTICNCKMYVGRNKTNRGKYVTMVLGILTQDFLALYNDEVLYLLKVYPLARNKGFSIEVLDEIPSLMYDGLAAEIERRIINTGANGRVFVRKQISSGEPIKMLLMTVDKKDLLEDGTVYAVRVQQGEKAFSLKFEAVSSRPVPEYQGMRADQILCSM